MRAMVGPTSAEAWAERLPGSPLTVRRARAAGRLPFIRIRDLIRYRPEDVEASLTSQAHDRHDDRVAGSVAAFR